MSEAVYANRKHKDTVFRMLYSDKRAILELYNALNGTDYQNPDDLTVTTLENAVYMAMKNDVSFQRDGLSESGRPDGYHAGKRGLYGHEERRILSSGREDDPVRAPVHVESEHAPARPDLYRAAYGKICE